MLTEEISHPGLSSSSQWHIMVLDGDLCPDPSDYGKSLQKPSL